MIPVPSRSATLENVPNVATPSKKAPLPIIGLQMENSIVYPAENPNTGSSSQLQLMKPFTMEPATRWPGKKLPSKLKMPGNPGHFSFVVKSVFLHIFAYGQNTLFHPD